MLSPSPTGVSSETGSSTRSKSSRTRSGVKPASAAISSTDGSRFSFCASWRRERCRAAHLLGDVDGQTDRAALVGERARHGLADPPGRVRRELVAHLVVELLDGADEPEVALLDQVEERHAGLRVVARDRHHEPEVALDQATLGALVSEVLAPGELALLGRREQPPVADLADVELQRVGGLEALVLAQACVLGLTSSSSSTSTRSRTASGSLSNAASGSGCSTYPLSAGGSASLRCKECVGSLNFCEPMSVLIHRIDLCAV